MINMVAADFMAQLILALATFSLGEVQDSTQAVRAPTEAQSCASMAAEMTTLTGRVGGIFQERQATASAGQPDVVGDTALSTAIGALGANAPNAAAPLLIAPLDARQQARQRANDRANEYEAQSEPEFTSGLDRLEHLSEAYQRRCEQAR